MHQEGRQKSIFGIASLCLEFRARSIDRSIDRPKQVNLFHGFTKNVEEAAGSNPPPHVSRYFLGGMDG